MCSYTHSSSGLLIYNMLRSPPPCIAQLSSRLKHPHHVDKRFTRSRDRQTGYQRSCPGCPALRAPSSSAPRSSAPIQLYCTCLSLLLPRKAFAAWSPRTSRSCFHRCHRAHGAGRSCRLELASLCSPRPAPRVPPRAESCQSRGGRRASPPLQ